MPDVTISTSRKNQIISELQSISIPPSDEAIAAVVQIIKDTPKCSVKDAVALYKASVNNQSQQANKEPQKANGQLNELLAGYSNEMKLGMKKQVVKNAVLGLIRDFESGDFSGCLDDDLIGELNTAMTTEYKFIELSDLSPKYLPSPNDMPQLLPAAVEIESVPIQE